MYWKRKGAVSERYCAAHNAKCPYHSAGRDQMVLSLAPNSVPEPWVCPDAVDEIAQFEREAEQHMRSGGDFRF
jgi:hypothetical protein